MPDTLNADDQPAGSMGQVDLVSGEKVALRLWRDEERSVVPIVSRRRYETVGYVIAGSADLTIEGTTVRLSPGDSWLVPAGAEHSYTVIDRFTAVEATAPPAPANGEDE